jgi:hypothetical protein
MHGVGALQYLKRVEVYFLEERDRIECSGETNTSSLLRHGRDLSGENYFVVHLVGVLLRGMLLR